MRVNSIAESTALWYVPKRLQEFRQTMHGSGQTFRALLLHKSIQIEVTASFIKEGCHIVPVLMLTSWFADNEEGCIRKGRHRRGLHYIPSRPFGCNPLNQAGLGWADCLRPMEIQYFQVVPLVIPCRTRTITTAYMLVPCLLSPACPQPHAPTTTTSSGTAASPVRSPGPLGGGVAKTWNWNHTTRSAAPMLPPRTATAPPDPASTSGCVFRASVDTSSRSRTATGTSAHPVERRRVQAPERVD